jgi:hypothetical protein
VEAAGAWAMRARRGANGESPTVSPPLAFPPPSARARERENAVRGRRELEASTGLSFDQHASKTTKVMGGDARRTGP